MKSQRIWGISGNWAEVYYACFIPTLIGRWAPKTLALVEPRAGERLLDVACGSGAVTRLAARAVGAEGQVAGVDLSPEILAVARKTRRQRHAAKIEWHEAPADKLPFDKGSFDIATCQFGLMFFPDKIAALKEMRRVLVKGGRIAIATWGKLENCTCMAAVAQAWREHYGEDTAAMLNRPHSMHDPGELKTLARKAGFTHVEAGVLTGHAHFESPKALVCSYGALAGLEADVAKRNALVKTVSRLLKPYAGPRGIHCPVEVAFVRARRS